MCRNKLVVSKTIIRDHSLAPAQAGNHGIAFDRMDHIIVTILCDVLIPLSFFAKVRQIVQADYRVMVLAPSSNEDAWLNGVPAQSFYWRGMRIFIKKSWLDRLTLS